MLPDSRRKYITHRKRKSQSKKTITEFLCLFATVLSIEVHFCDCAINAMRLSDPLLMISFHSCGSFELQCCCFCWRARATLQQATVVHVISGSLLCKIDLSKRECANVILFIQRYRLERDLDQTQIYLRRKKSNNSEVNLRFFLPLKTSFMSYSSILKSN